MNGPTNVTLLLGDRCNANCVMCQHAKARCTGSRPLWPDMPLEIVSAALASHRGTLQTVVLSSYGEPMLHPQFDAVLDACRGLRVDIITNGSKLSQYAEQIASMPGTLVVSIDSPVSEEYAGIRRGLELGSLIDGLLEFSDMPRHPYRDVQINMVVMSSNAYAVRSMMRFASGVGASRLALLRASVLDRTDAPDAAATPEQRQAVVDALANAPAGLEVHEYMTRETGPWPRCRIPWTGFDVNPDGSIMACCRIEQPMGHVSDPGFWVNGRFSSLRQQMEAGSVPDFPACQQCAYRTI